MLENPIEAVDQIRRQTEQITANIPLLPGQRVLFSPGQSFRREIKPDDLSVRRSSGDCANIVAEPASGNQNFPGRWAPSGNPGKQRRSWPSFFPWRVANFVTLVPMVTVKSYRLQDYRLVR